MGRKRRTLPVALLLVLFVAVVRAPAQDCLSYEPAEVTLSGTMVRRTFPGPPNYESVKKGDRPETYWLLRLTSPICVAASADNDAESGVTELQLILPAEGYARFRKFIGRNSPVTVTGRLSHAITGHHHTPVLLEVKATPDAIRSAGQQPTGKLRR